MNTLDALQKRHSVCGYTNRVIEDEKLKIILEYGNKAPNCGPFHMSVIKDATILNMIDETVLNVMKNSNNDFMKQRTSIPRYKPLYGAPIKEDN